MHYPTPTKKPAHQPYQPQVQQHKPIVLQPNTREYEEHVRQQAEVAQAMYATPPPMIHKVMLPPDPAAYQLYAREMAAQPAPPPPKPEPAKHDYGRSEDGGHILSEKTKIQFGVKEIGVIVAFIVTATISWTNTDGRISKLEEKVANITAESKLGGAANQSTLEELKKGFIKLESKQDKDFNNHEQLINDLSGKLSEIKKTKETQCK